MGTVLVKDIANGALGALASVFNPVNVAETLFFTADDGARAPSFGKVMVPRPALCW